MNTYNEENIQKQINEIISLLKSTNREGIDNVINYLKIEGYFDSPASTRFHGSKKHGLMVHSLSLYKVFDRFCDEFKLDVPKDSRIIIALLHDVCKVGLYSGSSKPYKYNFALGVAGHGMLSVARISQLIKLTDLELKTIRSHMGIYTQDRTMEEIKEDYKDFRIKMFYFCDEISTAIYEDKEE